MEIPNCLKRIERIQNTTKNLGWGMSELVPMLDRKMTGGLSPVCQYVVTVGHSYHKVVKTLVFEFYSDGRCGIYSDANVKDKFDILLFIGEEDKAVEKVINLLKIWFPEVRK